MKGGKAALGYTLVEVMITLAVSGMMFVLASNFISGRQAQTAFTQGVNEFASRMQNGIEEVQNGQYTDIKLNCTYTYNAPPATSTLNIDVGTAQQGENPQCVFLGKVYQFRQDVTGEAAEQRYAIFSLVAGRVDNKNKPITSLVVAAPKPIYKSATEPILTKQEVVPQRLGVKGIKVMDDAGNSHTNYFGVGILQSLGKDSAGGDLDSGNNEIKLYYVEGLLKDKTMHSASSTITGSTLKPARQVKLCVTDGSRYAEVVLGANLDGLTVGVEMKDSTPC